MLLNTAHNGIISFLLQFKQITITGSRCRGLMTARCPQKMLSLQLDKALSRYVCDLLVCECVSVNVSVCACVSFVTSHCLFSFIPLHRWHKSRTTSSQWSPCWIRWLPTPRWCLQLTAPCKFGIDIATRPALSKRWANYESKYEWKDLHRTNNELCKYSIHYDYYCNRRARCRW